MKKIKTYFKHQAGYLSSLLGFFVLPLFLYLEFSPYKAPKLPLVLLGTLIISQYAFHREKDYRKKIEKKVAKVLASELKRTPSGSEVIQRSSLILQFRGFSIIISALVTFILMVVYNEF